jgi:ABC-2 type transport system permease protein
VNRGHLGHVFLYELRRNFRRTGYLFMTFGLPLLAIVAVLAIQVINERNAANQSAAPQPTEDDGGFFADRLEKAGYVDYSALFDDPGSLSETLTRYADESAASAALQAGEIDGYYIIPSDYIETGDVTLVLSKFSLSRANSGPIEELIYDRLAGEVSPQLLSRLLDPTNPREVNLQRDESGETENDFGADFLAVYIFSIALMLGVFLTNGYLMQTVIEEKETRLIEILVSTMRPTELLTGKILALGLLGALQIVVWLGTLFVVSQMSAGADPTSPLAALTRMSIDGGTAALLLVYFVFGYLFFAGAYGMISAISTSMQEGPQFAVIFTLPAAIPFWFLSIFITTPDASLPVILSLIPLTSPLAMAMRITLTSVPAWQILLSLGLLVAADVLMIWLAGRMFRVQTLLAGQVPKLRDIPRLLRG